MKQATRRSFHIQLIIGMLTILVGLTIVFSQNTSVYAKKRPRSSPTTAHVTVFLDRLSSPLRGVDVVGTLNGQPIGVCLSEDNKTSAPFDANQTLQLFGSLESDVCFHDGGKEGSVRAEEGALISL